MEKEKEFYESQKDDLLKLHEGQFVLIRDQKLLGVFPTAQAAFEKGVELFGVQDMFIKQILKEDPTTFIPYVSTTHHANF